MRAGTGSCCCSDLRGCMCRFGRGCGCRAGRQSARKVSSASLWRGLAVSCSLLVLAGSCRRSPRLQMQSGSPPVVPMPWWTPRPAEPSPSMFTTPGHPPARHEHQCLLLCAFSSGACGAVHATGSAHWWRPRLIRLLPCCSHLAGAPLLQRLVVTHAEYVENAKTRSNQSSMGPTNAEGWGRRRGTLPGACVP